MSEESVMADFIEWTGGSCPVTPDTVVVVRLGPGHVTKTRDAADVRWEWVANGQGGDVTGYYPVTVTPSSEP